MRKEMPNKHVKLRGILMIKLIELNMIVLAEIH